MLTDEDRANLNYVMLMLAEQNGIHESDVTILLDMIDRQSKALEHCIKQRDGFRENYFAVVMPGPYHEEKCDIRTSNDHELQKIMRGEK